MLYPREPASKHQGEKNRGAKSTAQRGEDAAAQQPCALPQAPEVCFEMGSCEVFFGYRVQDPNAFHHIHEPQVHQRYECSNRTKEKRGGDSVGEDFGQALRVWNEVEHPGFTC
jgi:hypothetical protein